MSCLTIKNLIDACECAGKSPGVVSKLYWASLCDFTTIGDVDPAETNIDDLGIVDSAHTFTGTKGFAEISLEDNQNKLMIEKTGEGGFGNFKTTFEGLAGGYNPKIRGFLNQAGYSKGIAIAVLSNGKRIQIGSEAHPASMKANFDSLTSEASEAWGFKITLAATTPMMYEYKDALAITLISA
jgi:hypothetical protein